MRPLSELLTNDIVDELRRAVAAGGYPGLDFRTAMEFILTDGIVAQSGLPVESFLKLESWIRDQGARQQTFTATDLKNKTGLVLAQVLSGRHVLISKHGRPIAEIRPIAIDRGE